jgi:alkanesulfonate monooxygenase SsuD/methylene tetrahydromethanopterin reductase-like flavin-dependent oxidoreductase (luciferase family)
MHRRLVDVVEGMTAVFEGATEWHGRTRSFRGLETMPLPDGARTPYLMLAAHGPRTMELAARHADAWNTYGGPGSTRLAPSEFWAEVAGQAARFTEACERAGRDPAEVRRSLLLGYGTVRPTDSVEEYVDAAGQAGALGFDELVVYGPHSPGDGFGSDPRVHAEAIVRLGAGARAPRDV